MIWLLATRGASTKLRASPFTETVIAGVHSLVYKPGIEPVPFSGGDAAAGARGTFRRGLHRISGVLFTYDGGAAETLFAISQGIDLLIRYRAGGGKRIRTLQNMLFIGDALVAFPSLNTGLPELIGVPFRVQIPEGETLAQHVADAVEA